MATFIFENRGNACDHDYVYRCVGLCVSNITEKSSARIWMKFFQQKLTIYLTRLFINLRKTAKIPTKRII